MSEDNYWDEFVWDVTLESSDGAIVDGPIQYDTKAAAMDAFPTATWDDLSDSGNESYIYKVAWIDGVPVSPDYSGPEPVIRSRRKDAKPQGDQRRPDAAETGGYTPVAPTEAGMDILSGVPAEVSLPHIRVGPGGLVNRLTRVNPETGQLESREVTREEAIELSNKIAIDRAERIKAFIIKKYGEWRIPSIQDWGDFKREQKEESRRAAQERENGQEGN